MDNLFVKVLSRHRKVVVLSSSCKELRDFLLQPYRGMAPIYFCKQRLRKRYKLRHILSCPCANPQATAQGGTFWCSYEHLVHHISTTMGEGARDGQKRSHKNSHGRHCLHQARSVVRCSASRMAGALHPSYQEPIVRLTSAPCANLRAHR